MLDVVSVNAVNPVLYLNGCDLSVKALEVNGASYAPGIYQAGDFPAGWVSGAGRVIVQSESTVMVIK